MEKRNYLSMIWEVIRGRKSLDEFKEFSRKEEKRRPEEILRREEDIDFHMEIIRMAFSMAPFEVYMIFTATAGVAWFLMFKTFQVVLSFILG